MEQNQCQNFSLEQNKFQNSFSHAFLMVFLSQGLFHVFLMVFSRGLFSWSFLVVFSRSFLGLCCLFMVSLWHGNNNIKKKDHAKRPCKMSEV